MDIFYDLCLIRDFNLRRCVSLEIDEEPEPGWHYGEAMGLVRGYDSDTVSESLGFETACLAHRGIRGAIETQMMMMIVS